MSEAQLFYVPSLSISIDALKIIPADTGIQTPLIQSDVLAELNVPISVFKSLFEFKINEGVDINLLNDSDLTYKFNYVPGTLDPSTNIPTVVLDAAFMESTNCIATGSVGSDWVYNTYTASSTDRTVAMDYIRFLCFRLFNTAFNVPIMFTNEDEVKTGLNASAKAALHNRLVELTAYNAGAFLTKTQAIDEASIVGGVHPTYAILSQMLLNDPARFADLVPWETSTAGVYNAPFAINDTIVLGLTIKAAADQATVTTASPAPTFVGGVPNSGGRVYAIRFKVVA